jgi:hypothetical protein
MGRSAYSVQIDFSDTRRCHCWPAVYHQAHCSAFHPRPARRGAAAGLPALSAWPLAPTFAMLAALMIVRRVGSTPLIRPAGNAFTALDAESKVQRPRRLLYRHRDYRGGDALSAPWAKAFDNASGVLLAAGRGTLRSGLGRDRLWTFYHLGGHRERRCSTDEHEPLIVGIEPISCALSAASLGWTLYPSTLSGGG